MDSEIRGVFPDEDPVYWKKATSDFINRVPRFTDKKKCEEFIKTFQVEWTNKKHTQQWTNTIKTYASPTIGKMLAEDITSLHVLKILKPIWVTKHETASRVRQRLERIFSYSIASKYM